MKSSSGQAARLEQAIHAHGAYAHVRVHCQRGALYVASGDTDPIARLVPTTGQEYALFFRNRSGRWEPMPVMGSVPEIAKPLVEILGPYLDSWN
jgi:hypothetical protein